MTRREYVIFITALLCASQAECFVSLVRPQVRREKVGLQATQLENDDHDEIRVFDKAFNSLACDLLHELSVDHNQRTNDGSSIFTRPPHNEKPLSPIEHAIDSALLEIGDESKRVEYWSRDEYMNIDVHADIDETMLEDGGSVRCPLMGHVLYLQVKDGLNAPTCVFPSERMGWGQKEKEEIQNDGVVEKELVVVPCVQGRILRFPGNAMHSVPSPPHRYLLDRKEERKLRVEESAPCDEDDDKWLDDEDCDDFYDDDEEVERSVLLFNTWPDDELPPIGVNGDYATGALPEGIELSEEDANAYLKSEEARILIEWEEDYGKKGKDVRCESFSQWEEINVHDRDTNKEAVMQDEVNVYLMGNENRRLYADKCVKLKGMVESTKQALKETSIASRVRMHKI
mmetsp:Transcript_25882/g.38289  ORF Transcript_25882/g.38289 Transcript_25882/m.38289 type:complete len:400 (-) Transcript_25882:4-1203(-)